MTIINLICRPTQIQNANDGRIASTPCKYISTLVSLYCNVFGIAPSGVRDCDYVNNNKLKFYVCVVCKRHMFFFELEIR